MARVEYCFTCWPGGPVTPPPCLRCGSRRLYYASGLCALCHPSAVPPVDSCRNCLAWGATRHLKWLCRGCNSWCRKYTVTGPCRLCRYPSVLDLDGVCRLCRKQAAKVRGARAHATLEETTHEGQQLFIADLFSGPSRSKVTPPATPCSPVVTLQQPPRAAHRQLLLFEMNRSLRHRGMHGLAQAADPEAAAFIEPFVKARASQHGWSRDMAWNARTGIKIMISFQDTPGTPITASDVTVLAEVGLPIRHVLDVLDDADMLDDDRVPAVARWFERQIAALPEPMTDELRTWFRVMYEGSTSAPRRRPRTAITIQLHLGWAMPAITTWAAEGKASLREISRHDVAAVLPTERTPRAQMGQGLRSVFRLRLARHRISVLFAMLRDGTFYEPRLPQATAA
jgi:hypothetical protein